MNVTGTKQSNGKTKRKQPGQRTKTTRKELKKMTIVTGTQLNLIVRKMKADGKYGPTTLKGIAVLMTKEKDADGKGVIRTVTANGRSHQFEATTVKDALETLELIARGETPEGVALLTETPAELAAIAPKPTKKAKSADGESTRSGKLGDFFGYSVTAVIRWMGANKYTVADAKAVCTKRGFTPADAAIVAAISRGKLGTAGYSMPELTKAQAAEIKADVAGSAVPEAAEEPKAKRARKAAPKKEAKVREKTGRKAKKAAR